MKKRDKLISDKFGIVIRSNRKVGPHLPLFWILRHMTESKAVFLPSYISKILCIPGFPSNQASFAIPQPDTLWASLKALKAIIAFKQ